MVFWECLRSAWDVPQFMGCLGNIIETCFKNNRVKCIHVRVRSREDIYMYFTGNQLSLTVNVSKLNTGSAFTNVYQHNPQVGLLGQMFPTASASQAGNGTYFYCPASNTKVISTYMVI